jgi:hypothetical protein
MRHWAGRCRSVYCGRTSAKVAPTQEGMCANDRLNHFLDARSLVKRARGAQLVCSVNFLLRPKVAPRTFQTFKQIYCS